MSTKIIPLRAWWKTAFCLLLLLTSLSLASAQAAAPIVPKGARVAVIGDSITEQKLYSRFIELYLIACMPQLDARVMQFGWGGEAARGFAGRMNNDLALFKPTMATTCYGMNDGGYRAFTPEIGKYYETPMRDIVTRLKAAGVTVVVGSPGAVDTKYFMRCDPAIYNDNLAHLRDIAKKAADDAGMPFANVHDALIDAMAKAKATLGDAFSVCGGDGVHPPAAGHLVMAYAFLKAMGFDGNLGAITIDMKGTATADGGHKVLSANGGVVEIESSRYPFCFYGNEKDYNGTRSILPFVPFNQDLNRLTLVVKNLGAEQGKVTWGATSKVFSRADLEKGINLAAEFTDNPFTPVFQKLDAAVSVKQNYETYLIKSQITGYPYLQTLSGNDPEMIAAIEAFRNKLWAFEETQQNKVRAALVPVKHTITVSPEAQPAQ
ncbi:MAG TPA: SGNH/GDSL hydrolase family protein [Armatimonadota bacterium]|jgi:lysophospholipase L1-like esterase